MTDSKEKIISEVQTRLREFILYMGIEVKAFEKSAGLSNGFVSKVGDTIRPASFDKILSEYPQLNKNWILTGVGSMLLDDSSVSNNNQTDIPMYNFPAAASSIEIYNDPNEVKVIGHMNIPGSARGSFALPVYGDSMYPTLASGSWCVLRPISDVQDIVWGEIYYIEWGDYRMFKRVLVGESEDEIILWSDNQTERIQDKPKYAPVKVKKERIRRLCLLTDIVKKPNY